MPELFFFTEFFPTPEAIGFHITFFISLPGLKVMGTSLLLILFFK
jgi:hypothetical protein